LFDKVVLCRWLINLIRWMNNGQMDALAMRRWLSV